MQRLISVFCLVLVLTGFASRSFAQKGKVEVALGYGYLSIYSLVNGSPFDVSSGTPAVSVRYYLTSNVTLGIGAGTENISNWGSFTTIAPEVTFAYMDTWQENIRIKLYGAASYGVTIFQNNNLKPGEADNSGVWAYAFQATPFGIRIGRQVAAFAEVGLGYKGIIHGGLAVRFPKHPLGRHSAE